MEELIKASDYGLEQKQADQITKGIKTILKERDVLAESYNDVINLEITGENISTFRTLRLQIRDNRTKGLEKWRKTNKAYFLAGGNFVQAISNREQAENERMESKLMKAENHFIDLENERVEKLKEERENVLKRYEVEVMPERIGNLSKEVWENYLAGVKVAYDARKKAEEEAEKERLENLRIKKLHQTRKESLIGWWQYLTDDDREKNFGEMSEESFEKLFQNAQDRKKKRDAADEKVRLENIRLKEEKEAREKEEERIQNLHIQRKDEVIDLWDYMPIDKQGSNFGKWKDEEWNELICFLTQSKEDEEEKQKENARLEKLWRDRLELLNDCGWNGQAAFDHKDDSVIISYIQLITISDKAFEVIKNNWNSKIAVRIKKQEEEKETKRISDLHLERKSSITHLWNHVPKENRNVNFGQWNQDIWDVLVNHLKKCEKDEQEQLEKDLNKGDSAKMMDLITDLIALKSKYKFKSKKNQLLYSGLSNEIDKIVRHLTN